MTQRWGATPLADGGTRFALWAPDRDAVTLEIADAAPVAMTAAGDGWFVATVAAGAGTRYRYRIAEDLAVPDPASRGQSGGVHGWSVVQDPAFDWADPDWRGRPWQETVLIELHAGVLGGFDGVRERLPALAELGITAIELMPVNAFGGTRNWGYDGVLPYAPAEAYGTPAQLKALVDAAHGLGLSIFLDVVFNHFGPDGNYLGAYAGDFFDRDVVDNALMWLDEYRFDGLRFDAVHAIGDPAFLDAMATEIRAALPGRHIHLVLENEGNDAERLRAGGYDAQWNDDFHNVLHVLLTGETSAYYADFADRPAERLARCLAEGFVYQGEASPNHDGRPRGRPSAHLAPTRFVAFLQNHDQIGNRALGERLTVLTDTARLRAATALLVLCPQIPMLFMGDEVGSRSPFLFFTDFHDELADAVREGRRREFAKFDAFADPAARARIPDPNAQATFAASRPEPGPDAADWRALLHALIAVRRSAIVPHLVGAMAAGAEATGDAAVVARWRLADGSLLTIALDLADDPGRLPEIEGELLYAEGDRFRAWIAR